MSAVCFETKDAKQSAYKDCQSGLVQYLAGPRADHSSALWVLGRALGIQLLAKLSNLSTDVSQVVMVAVLQGADGSVMSCVRVQYMQGCGSALAAQLWLSAGRGREAAVRYKVQHRAGNHSQ